MHRIVTVLSGMPSDRKTCTAACLLAKRLGANVEGLYIRLDASEILPRLGEGLSGAAIDSLLQSTGRIASEAAVRARSFLQAAAEEAAIEVMMAPPERPGPSVSFYEVEGPALDVLDSESRLADLLVFAEPNDEAPVDWMGRIEHALLATRRPVLVVRGAMAEPFGDKVLAAYDGSIEAANAIVRSAPILAAARETEVLQVTEKEGAPDHAQAAVRYLRQHGANAAGHVQRLSRSNVGDEIGARANAIWASLIVLGGYGRSRLRELILGGTTRHMILQAPVPVLLAH